MRKIYTQMKELRLINKSLAQRNSDVAHTTLHIETPSWFEFENYGNITQPIVIPSSDNS